MVIVVVIVVVMAMVVVVMMGESGEWGRGVVVVPVAIDMRQRKIRIVETIMIAVRYGKERKKRRRESQV